MSADEIERQAHHPDYERLSRETREAAETQSAQERQSSSAKETIVLPQTSPLERRDVAAEITRQERATEHNDARIAAQYEAKHITGHDAHYERGRFDREMLMADRAREVADEKRKVEDARVAALAKENAATLARQAKELEHVGSRFEATGQNPFERQADFAQQTSRHSHERERFEKSLKEQERSNDPFGSQQRAATTEYSHFMREQREFENRIRAADKLTEREALNTQKQIRAAEYIAYTSERIAVQSARMHGTPNNELTEKHQDRAAQNSDSASQLRSLYQQRYSNITWESFSADGGASRAQPDGAKREGHAADGRLYSSQLKSVEGKGPSRPQETSRGGRS